MVKKVCSGLLTGAGQRSKTPGDPVIDGPAKATW